MTHESSRRRRWLYLALGVFVVGATLLIAGCSVGKGGGLFDWFKVTPADPSTGGGDAGNGVPGVWGNLGRSIEHTAGQIRWWFALGGLATFGLGVYNAIRGNILDAAKCLGAAIGLGILGSIVGALFTGVAWIVVVGLAVAGGFIAFQWARGGSVFGHSWACVKRLVRTGHDAHDGNGVAVGVVGVDLGMGETKASEGAD